MYWESEEDYTKWLDGVVNYAKKQVIFYDKQVKYYKKLIQENKEKIKREKADIHPSEFVIKMCESEIKRCKEMIKIQGDTLQDRRKHLAYMQISSKQQDGNTCIRKLTIKEKSHIAINKGFKVIQGGLCENA
ncbi:MAG: hypothetical protein KBA28_09660 [Syntrophaceae bacterium]|nr:hypothetical protein [Syntrophaceae bacterium]